MTETHRNKENSIIKTDKMIVLELSDDLERTIQQQVIDALIENERVKAKAAKSLGIGRQLIGDWIRVLAIDVNRLTPEKHSQWADESYEKLKQFR